MNRRFRIPPRDCTEIEHFHRVRRTRRVSIEDICLLLEQLKGIINLY